MLIAILIVNNVETILSVNDENNNTSNSMKIMMTSDFENKQ